MGRQAFLGKMVLVLALLWTAVWGFRHWSESRRLTAASVAAKISAADFADWSGESRQESPAMAREREKVIRDISADINRLDFSERQKARDDRSGERFFTLLSPEEKKLFLDLTIRESLGKFMDAIDSLPPQERRKFVEQGLRDLREGKTAADMQRAMDLGDDVLERITSEGMRAYFEKAGTETKLDLAPLMESANEIMQGLQQKEIMPGSR